MCNQVELIRRITMKRSMSKVADNFIASGQTRKPPAQSHPSDKRPAIHVQSEAETAVISKKSGG